MPQPLSEELPHPESNYKSKKGYYRRKGVIPPVELFNGADEASAQAGL